MATDGRTPAECAVERERQYRRSIGQWNRSGDWDALLDALEHACVAQLSWLDAGNEELAKRADGAREHVRDMIWAWLPGVPRKA